jgi:hypothetical protein
MYHETLGKDLDSAQYRGLGEVAISSQPLEILMLLLLRNPSEQVNSCIKASPITQPKSNPNVVAAQQCSLRLCEGMHFPDQH